MARVSAARSGGLSDTVSRLHEASMTGQAVWRRGGPGQGAATGRKRARCAPANVHMHCARRSQDIVDGIERRVGVSSMGERRKGVL